MMRFSIGLVAGVFVVLLAGYLFVIAGGVPMATKPGPWPMETYLAHQALATAIGKSASEESPLPANEANLVAGARIYTHNGCSDCHGRLGEGATGLSKRVYPNIPPLLPPSDGVTDDPVGQTHWVVRNGIRFSAMPSFDGKLSDEELWQVSLFLRHANKLPNAARDALST